MARTVAKWFHRQPVGVRAALITGAAAIIVGLLTFTGLVVSNRQEASGPFKRLESGVDTRNGLSVPPSFEAYELKQPHQPTPRTVTLLTLTLDPRHSGLEYERSRDAECEFVVRGKSWPVLLAAFHNGTDDPVVFSGVEVFHELAAGSIECAGIVLEPFAAVDIHNGEGFQQFAPPLLLPPTESGAIHLRLAPSPTTLKEPYGVYSLKFQIGTSQIQTPRFRWSPD